MKSEESRKELARRIEAAEKRLRRRNPRLIALERSVARLKERLRKARGSG